VGTRREARRIGMGEEVVITKVHMDRAERGTEPGQRHGERW